MVNEPSPERSAKPGDRSARVLLRYVVVAVLFSVVVLYLALFVLPPFLVPSSKGVSFAVLAKAENDARGSLLTGLGVLAAIVVGTAGFLSWRESHRALEETRRENDLNWKVSQATLEQTRRQNDETHRQNVLDLYSKAVDQLGQAGVEKLNARVGAVHILEEVSRDEKAPELYWPIIEIFVALLREGPSASERAVKTRFPPDLEAALRALGRRKGSDRFPIDLSGAWLVGADFRAPDNDGNFVPELKDVSFAGADLTGANFWRAKLPGADFRGAFLSRADLTYCVLEKADFREAHLNEANLSFAVLSDVMLKGANFEGAELVGVKDMPMAQLRLAPSAAIIIGDLQAGLGDVAAAEKAYEEGMNSDDPYWASAAAVNLGDLLAGRGDVAGAKKAYQQAIDSHHIAHASKAAVNLGNLLAGRGDVAGAKKAYQKAIHLGDYKYAAKATQLLEALREPGAEP